MKIIILCISLAFLTFGCSSPAKAPVDPLQDLEKKRVSKTVRHPLPKFDDTTDEGKLYIIKLNGTNKK
jgi:PBP1b-binding outer membrane lipoprotein LpoB